MKKLRKLFAVLLAVCMMMSLLSVSAFAEESLAEENALFKCEFACEHTHTGVDGKCYTTQLTCTKHMHGDKCYTDGVLTCTDGVLDQICGFDYEHPAHDATCNHVHRNDCYDCGKEAGAYECNTSDAHEHNTGCPTHVHDACACKCNKTFDCGMEVHAHINIGEETEGQDPCYQYHVHVGEAEANGCYGRVMVCALKEHTHEVGCLTETAKTEVENVITLLSDMPTMAEVRSSSNIQLESEDQAGWAKKEALYAVHRDTGLAERKVAIAAYDALDAELKALVPEELVAKIYTTLEARLGDLSVNITRGNEDYIYKYVNQYEYTNHETKADNTMCTFMLVDTNRYDGKTWTPDGAYKAGESNYDVVYCSDNGTSIVNGTNYQRINLEQAGYYGKDAAEHIRAIVLSSYPFVSEEEMRENLRGKLCHTDGTPFTNLEIDTLEEIDMIAGTQMAIWHYANESLTEQQLYDRTHYGWTWGMFTGYRYLGPLTLRTWFAGKQFESMYGEWVDSIATYLKNLKGVSVDDKQIVINDVEILGAEPVQATDRKDVYSVVMKIKLNSGGSSSKDNINITVTSYSVDEETGERIVTGTSVKPVDGSTTYDMVVEAKYGEVIEIVVEGTQRLPQGAYFYQPEPADKNGDGVATGREVSQNLVGVAMGDTAVRAEMLVTDLPIPAPLPEGEDPASAKLTVKKTNEIGAPLTGAEFTVYRVSNDGKTTYNIGTYPVDENGCAVLTGLLAGTYQLKETTAPAGYVAMDETVVFEVTDGETAEIRLFNNPDDVRCDGAEDGYILTVVNCPEPVPSNPGPNPRPNPKPDPDPEVTIPEEEPPLAELPDEEPPLASLPDEDPPLAMLPEEDVPLALLPMTGDASVIWMALSALSGAGLFVTRKKRDEE